MGYARLHFDNTGTISMRSVLRDIAGVITGTYTSTSQLLVATKNLSQIVNTAGRGNWEYLFPVAYDATPTNGDWVLRAPCVDNSKYKYIRLTGLGNDGSTAAAASTLRAADPTASNNFALMVQACTAATSSANTSNPTWYNTNITTGSVKNTLVGPYFYISWSSRHCVIVSSKDNTGNAALAMYACFEHVETPSTTFRSVAPFCFHSYFGTTYNNSVTAPSSLILSSPVSYMQVMNHYIPVTTVSTGNYNLLSNINGQQADMTVVSESSNVYPTILTKNSTGASSIYMQPLFFHQHHLGVPHHYLSYLSDVYRVPSGIGAAGDMITVGSDTYVYLPLTVSSTYAIAVKMA